MRCIWVVGDGEAVEVGVVHEGPRPGDEAEGASRGLQINANGILVGSASLVGHACRDSSAMLHGDGAQVRTSSVNVQRLHFKLRVQRIHNRAQSSSERP